MATIGLVNATLLKTKNRRRQRTADEADKATNNVLKPDPAVSRCGARIGACEYRSNDVTRIELEWQDEPLQDTATIYGVSTAAEKQRYLDNEPKLLEAIKHFSDSCGPMHTRVGEAWSEFGDILCGAGMYEQAHAAYDQALGIFVSEHGDVHRAVAIAKSKLGLTFLYACDYDAAVQLLLTSQDILRVLKAQATNDYADNLNTLGVIRLRLGATQLATDHFRRALEMWQTNHPPVHPDIALAMSNLGTTYAMLDALDMAESYYRTALDMRRILFCNSGHIAMAVGLNNLAMLLRCRGELGKAEPLIRESLAVRIQLCGVVSPSTVTGLHNLATILRENGNPLGAEVAQRDSIVACSVLCDDDHVDVAITRANLADTLVAQGRHAEALREASVALIALKSAVGANHWRVKAVNGIRGVALARQGDFATAEPLILTAYESIKAARGDHSVLTRRALDRVVQYFADSGQAGRLQEYRTLRQQLYPEP